MSSLTKRPQVHVAVKITACTFHANFQAPTLSKTGAINYLPSSPTDLIQSTNTLFQENSREYPVDIGLPPTILSIN